MIPVLSIHILFYLPTRKTATSSHISKINYRVEPVDHVLLHVFQSQSKDGGSSLRLRNGLVTQHAYSVTGLARVRSKMGEAPLVRSVINLIAYNT